MHPSLTGPLYAIFMYLTGSVTSIYGCLRLSHTPYISHKYPHLKRQQLGKQLTLLISEDLGYKIQNNNNEKKSEKLQDQSTDMISLP